MVTQAGVSEQGMVMDFGEIKRILMEKIHDPLDHGFMVWKDDVELREFLSSQGYRMVVMDDVPTAENIARWCFRQCLMEFVSVYGNRLRLKAVTVWETPNSSATYSE